jgi:hypothetical protein
VLVVEGVGCVEMGVGIRMRLCVWVACGVAPCTVGVVFAGTVGILVSVTANVGEGVGVVGVGVCQPGGVLVGFTADIGADSKCGALACAFAIPSIAPKQEKRRSKREHAAIRAREKFFCVLRSLVFFISAFLNGINRQGYPIQFLCYDSLNRSDEDIQFDRFPKR